MAALHFWDEGHYIGHVGIPSKQMCGSTRTREQECAAKTTTTNNSKPYQNQLHWKAHGCQFFLLVMGGANVFASDSNTTEEAADPVLHNSRMSYGQYFWSAHRRWPLYKYFSRAHKCVHPECQPTIHNSGCSSYLPEAEDPLTQDPWSLAYRDPNSM